MSDALLRVRKTARSQYTSPRRQEPMGVIGLHTSESIMDTVGPDTGAENVAEFIIGRGDPGSYHDLVDSDSIVWLVRYEDESYHIATHTFNRRTTSVAFACKTSDWRRMSPARREAFLRNGAKAAARQNAYHARHGKPVPARRITLAQALAGQRGFLAHGDADPSRRTDPGIAPPNLFPFDEFLQYYAEEIGSAAPTPAPGELSMSDVQKILDRLDSQDREIKTLRTVTRETNDFILKGSGQQGREPWLRRELRRIREATAG